MWARATLLLVRTKGRKRTHHIGHEVTVARSVEERDAPVLGFQLSHGHIHGYAPRPFFLLLIKHPRKRKGPLALCSEAKRRK